MLPDLFLVLLLQGNKNLLKYISTCKAVSVLDPVPAIITEIWLTDPFVIF